MRNLWASFDFLVHFLIIFFIVQSFKNEISSKILDIQKYNIVRHWFSSKNWIFVIFFKKVSIDGFTHYLWKILLIFIVQSFKKWNFIINPWYTKIQHCTTLIFLKKLEFFEFFKESFYWRFWSIFHRLFFLLSKVSKNRNFPSYPNILIYLWSEFYASSNIVRLLDFSHKNWETYLRLLILRKILLTVLHIYWSKVSHPKLNQKIDFSIYPNILYICDQTFYARINNQTIRILRIKIEKLMSVFWRFLVTLFMEIIINFYCPKFQKWNFIKNPWYTKIQHCTTLIFLKKLDFCYFF